MHPIPPRDVRSTFNDTNTGRPLPTPPIEEVMLSEVTASAQNLFGIFDSTGGRKDDQVLTKLVAKFETFEQKLADIERKIDLIGTKNEGVSPVLQVKDIEEENKALKEEVKALKIDKGILLKLMKTMIENSAENINIINQEFYNSQRM